jgi:hypothetical protein
MFKKTMVLAMALGVVAAFALPATASATWKHHGTAIQQDVQFGLTGNFGTTSQVGGVQCQITANVQLTAGTTTGHVQTFAPHPTSPTANCVGKGPTAFCQFHTVEPTGLPWSLHTTGTVSNPTIQLTHGDIHMQMTGGFCPYKFITKTAASWVLTPNPANGNTVTSFSLTGSGESHYYNEPGGPQTTAPEQTTGSWSVEAPNSGTYSI